MVTEIKTYGFNRKSQVPDIPGTTPKVCSKCNLWFAAQPRFRVCQKDQPKHLQAKRREQAKLLTNASRHTMTRGSEFVRQTRRSRDRVLLGSALCTELALDAFRIDRQAGISFGCSKPKEQQADHLSSSRRHPYAGTRPEESGYCDVPCNCTCHTNAYDTIEDGR